ncbi:glutathione S-transferase, partial [Klebsiella pneumoniae]|jgi:GST-like protein
LLDCYIAAMYRWGPRQAWFDDHAPKFAAIARAVCQRPELAAALRRNKLI